MAIRATDYIDTQRLRIDLLEALSESDGAAGCLDEEDRVAVLERNRALRTVLVMLLPLNGEKSDGG